MLEVWSASKLERKKRLRPVSKGMRQIGNVAGGVAFAGLFALVAFFAASIPALGYLSPAIIAIILGIAYHNFVGTPAWAGAGLRFSLRPLLRFAIVLLGAQLTFDQIVSIGGAGVVIVTASLIATFLFTVGVGALLGIDRGLAQLIAAGTAVCGASAILATTTVTKTTEQDVAYAVASISIFGTLSMFLFPLFASGLGLDPGAFGLWVGASIHEVAQVVAAAVQNGHESLEAGTVTKLSRVLLLAPLLIAIGAFNTRAGTAIESGQTHGNAPVPWFIAGFLAVVAINSVFPIPAETREWLAIATKVLLSVSFAALGLEISLSKLRATGLRPLILGALSWIFISVFSLTLIKLMT